MTQEKNPTLAYTAFDQVILIGSHCIFRGNGNVIIFIAMFQN